MLVRNNFIQVILLLFLCFSLAACNKPKDNSGNPLEIGKNYLMTNDGLKLLSFPTDIEGKEVVVGNEYVMTDNGLKLIDKLTVSKEDALKIINSAYGLPKPVPTYIRVGKDSTAGTGILNLQKDGYFIPNPKLRNSRSRTLDDKYIPTEKGMPFIKGIDWNAGNLTYGFRGSVCSKVIKEIGEILVDEDTKTAIINFTMTYEKIEPLYSNLCVDRQCKYYGENLSQTWATRVTLKKYNQGWRIVQN